MIRSNLAIILAQRRLKITQVSHQTGISRTTLTALSNNSCQGIQFSTLDTLCKYLNTTPEMLISFIPYSIEDVRVEIEYKDGTEFWSTLHLTITENMRTMVCSFPCIVQLVVKDLRIEAIRGHVYLWNIILTGSVPEDYEAQNQTLLTLLAKMPLAFQNDLSEKVGAAIFDDINKHMLMHNPYVFSKDFFSTSIIWPTVEK